MQTEAAVLVGPERVEVQGFRLPEIGADDGILKVEACGICGSDIEPFRGGGAPVGAYRCIEVPVILGHEIVGRIERAGPHALARWGVEEGDRVVVERWMPCGHCDACHQGAFASCIRYVDGRHLFYGGTPTSVTPSLWGGYARHMYLHPDTIMHRVSSHAPASAYSLFLPLANSVEWVQHTGGVGVGSRILIQGPGPIGLMCVLVARAAGAESIIVSGLGHDQDRLELARELGATATVQADSEDVGVRCRELTGGDGVDLVVDVTSSPTLEPVATAVDAARRGGRIVLATEHRGRPGDGPAAQNVLAQVQMRTLWVIGVRGRGRAAAGVALKLLADPTWAETLSRLCRPVLSLGEVGAGFAALTSGHALHASVAPGQTSAAT